MIQANLLPSQCYLDPVLMDLRWPRNSRRSKRTEPLLQDEGVSLQGGGKVLSRLPSSVFLGLSGLAALQQGHDDQTGIVGDPHPVHFSGGQFAAVEGRSGSVMSDSTISMSEVTWPRRHHASCNTMAVRQISEP
jgi:hypothetical protein